MDQMWCDDAITRAKQHHTKQNENLFLFLQHGLNVVLLCTYYSLTYPVNKNNSYFAKKNYNAPRTLNISESCNICICTQRSDNQSPQIHLH